MKNKNRYILAFYALKPRKNAPTNQKGWMDNSDNLQWDESFKMTEGLKTKDRMNAQVVLDIDDKKIIKNWKADEGENDYDKILEYYYRNYSNYINDFMNASNRARK